MIKENVSDKRTVLPRPSPHRYRLLFSSVVIVASTLCAMAQNANDIGTPAESKPGQSTASTYAMDKIETVNLANGNMSLHIPLVTIGGRGSASYTIALSYNSKLWGSQHDVEFTPDGWQDQGIPPQKIDHFWATYDDNVMSAPNVLALGSGWSILISPAIKTRTFGIDPIGGNPCHVRESNCGYKYVLTRMWLTLPDGSEIELRDSESEGAPALAPNDGHGLYLLTDRDRGRVWHSVDGSAITFISDTNNQAAYPDGWVFLPDGSRLRMVGGACTKIIDRNGNFITIGLDMITGGRLYTDELGRQVLLQSSASVVTITVKGYAGVADRVMTINTGLIGDLNNLRADFQSLPRPFTSGDYLRSLSEGDVEHTIPGPHTDLFIGSEGGEDIGDMAAVTQLNLLDGRSFHFR